MPSIADVRQQYPQYSDMSDQQLADALHAKFYADMPADTFYAKVGLKTAAPKDAAYAGARAKADAEDSHFGFGDAVTANLGVRDEIAGGIDALIQGGKNLVNRATGKPIETPMATAYKAGADASDAAAQRFAKDHPVQNTVAGLGGLAAFGPGKPVGLLKGVLGGAAVGAPLSFANAQGDAKDRIAPTVVGTALGGALGTLPAAGGAIKRTGSALAEATSRVTSALGRTSAAPTAAEVAAAAPKAEAYVSELAQRAGATPDSLRNHPLNQAGENITAAEAMGRTGKTQLKAVASRSGKTGDALESDLRQRIDAVPQQVQDAFHAVTGTDPSAIAGDFAGHTANLRAKAAPLYDKAYSQPPPQSDLIDNLMGRPSMRDALNRAANIAAEEGRDPAALGFDLDAQGNVVRVKAPTMQTMDYVKRGLDDVLEGYRSDTTGKLKLDERGRAIQSTLRSFRDELVRLRPSYGDALAAGGEPLRQEEAFRIAPQMVSNTVPARVFNQRYAGMTPAQQEALKGGFLNRVYEQVQSGRLKLKDMQQPVFREKLGTMFGGDAADKLTGILANKAEALRNAREMMPGGGSPTMPLQAADAEQAQAIDTMAGAAKHLAKGKPVSAALHVVTSPIAGLYRGAQAPIDQATRDQVGELLRQNPNALADVLERTGKPKPKPTGATNALANAAGIHANRKTANALSRH
jgi:hypothetical protein